ncbi:MAG: 5-(carboxyamino)imidazole ribonucleotide mutase [Candidatus Aminicenantes bacterium]|nr:MAG: 5-(carboxyamino)imidazole ribonucleotide mutase [Candidatus Aminicenantes bacterium]
MKVGIFIGSDSDFPIVEGAIHLMKKFDVKFGLEVTSAHRSPERTRTLIKKYEESGVSVFIAIAGKAAHLAGVVASHTTRPVIGVPVGGSELGGLDALLSTSQMPKGIPVACMGIGKSGASNAALLAIQILALSDLSLEEKLKANRSQMAANVEAASQKIQDKL